MAINKMSNGQLQIEVAYAAPARQSLLKIIIQPGSTIQAAIEQSGILTMFPEIDLNVQKVGIFGKSRQLTDIVQNGDRIEIYRPLLIDPKEARRKKARRR
jgi:hypothetical protein